MSNDRGAGPPRFMPGVALPAYAHVPGRTPHPTRNRTGPHMPDPGMPEGPLAPAEWRANPAFLYGTDLFNAGYYWEAHEVWEGVWRAAGRKGPAAGFLKGLIALAAAGVKAREGQPEGVRRHGKRAQDLFARTRQTLDDGEDMFFGLCLSELIRLAGDIRKRAESPASGDARRIFADAFLWPATEG